MASIAEISGIGSIPSSVSSGRLTARSSLVPSSRKNSSIPSSLRSSRLDLFTPRGGSWTTSSSPSRRSSVAGKKSPLRGSAKYKAKVIRKASKQSLAVNANGIDKTDADEEKAVPEALEILIDRCTEIDKTAVLNMKKVEQNHAAVTAEITKYRRQVDNVLDIWEKEARERVNEIMEGDVANLNSVIDECAKLLDEIYQLSEITEYRTKLLEVNVIETEAKNTYREYKFTSNENISNLLKTESYLGEVEVTHEVAGLYNNLNTFDNFVPTYLEEIDVKTEQDTFDCDVTGMAMIGNNRLVVADIDNKSLKTVNTKTKKVTSQLCFSSGPWDLTVVHRGQLAVTFPNERLVQFVLTAGGLTKDRHIKLNGECHGITYRRGCLIVSFRSPGKVQIMDLQGRVLKIIKHDVHQNKIFDWPDYVAVSKDGNSIYVSDWHRNAVTRLSWKGEVTGVYKDTIGTKMAGLAVAQDGSLLVCKRTSHSIIKLSPDCNLCDILLEEKHGLKYPWSLCFCDEEHKLYVDNNRNSNTIAVFELR